MTTTLLLGGRVYSPTAPEATAMAVADGVVLWVGQDAAALALYGGADEVVRLAGAFVAPAFVDAHVHATSAGLLVDGLDLTGCSSLGELLAALRTRTAGRPGAPLWGHGWDETRWPEGRPPTRAELDAAAGGAAVYLSRIDVHSALVSSALAERAAGVRAADGWSADGPLSRQANRWVRRAAKESITAGQRRDAQLAFLRSAASRGVASVHECAGPDISSPEDLAELLALSAGDPDVPEVVGYWGELDGFGVAQRVGAVGLAGDLFVDGALGSRTAALREPYADAPDTCGARYLDAGQVAEHVVACTRAGVQAGFHVIGDAAVDAVVAGFARAEAVVGVAALAARRHRLEHLEMVDAGQAALLARCGVVASVQPAFDAEWGGPQGMYAQRLGVERGTRLNPLSTLAAAGMMLAFGSDAPVTPVDPWAAVRAAVHHRTEGFGISPRAAFTAHTRAGWRAAGMDDPAAGTLVPGAPATYAVWEAAELVVSSPDPRARRWSTDPRSRVPGLPSLEPGLALPTCLRTVSRGHVLHDREGAFR